MALELSATARELVMAGVKDRHPDYNPEQIRLAVLRLLQGKQIFSLVYPGADIKV